MCHMRASFETNHAAQHPVLFRMTSFRAGASLSASSNSAACRTRWAVSRCGTARCGRQVSGGWLSEVAEREGRQLGKTLPPKLNAIAPWAQAHLPSSPSGAPLHSSSAALPVLTVHSSPEPRTSGTLCHLGHHAFRACAPPASLSAQEMRWKGTVHVLSGNCPTTCTFVLSSPPPLQDPAFRAAAAQRYAQLRTGTWTDAAVSQAVTQVAAYIHDASLRSIQRC